VGGSTGQVLAKVSATDFNTHWLTPAGGGGGSVDPGANGFRLSLVAGDFDYVPQALVPSATDTSAETCDFAVVHGWVTGTVVYPEFTVGGLTLGTQYFIRAVDTDTVSFHTTYADAVANTNRVNLTASITARIFAMGVVSDTLYLEIYQGNRISLYDGSAWQSVASAGASLVLSGLTVGARYDAYAWNNAGVVTLELSAAWASGTARTDAFVTQDGVPVKSGTLTRRLLGCFIAESATTIRRTTEFVGLHNLDNQRLYSVSRFESAATWTYTTDTWRQSNANAANQITVISSRGKSAIAMQVNSRGQNTANSGQLRSGIGYDSTINPVEASTLGRAQLNSASRDFALIGGVNHSPRLGQHYYAWLERASVNGTTTWLGTAADDPQTVRSGLTGQWQC